MARCTHSGYSKHFMHCGQYVKKQKDKRQSINYSGAPWKLLQKPQNSADVTTVTLKLRPQSPLNCFSVKKSCRQSLCVHCFQFRDFASDPITSHCTSFLLPTMLKGIAFTPKAHALYMVNMS